MKFKHLILLLVEVLSTLSESLQAKTIWEGFNFDVYSDAYENDVPIMECAVITNEYEVAFKFGEAKKGNLKKSTVKQYDEHGYLTDDGEKTYENIYLPDGRISKRNIYENDKLKEVWIYEYLKDEKGPGFLCTKYNADGDAIGLYGAQNKMILYPDHGTGGSRTVTLNSQFRPIKEVIEITNYRQSVTITSNNNYNSSGFIESSTITGAGHQETTNYRDYMIGDDGYWRSVTKTGYNPCLLERDILTKEDYVVYLKHQEELKEQARLEAERKEKERLESETNIIKERISILGYATEKDIKDKPIYSIELTEPTDEKKKTAVNIVLPDKPSTFKSQDYPIIVTLKEPAKIKYPNKSIETVPFKIEGELLVIKNNLRSSNSLLEVKVDFDKKLNKWYLKNAKDLVSKNRMPNYIVEALGVEIERLGESQPFKNKKIYLGNVFQYEVRYIDRTNPNTVVNKTFPIRFTLTDKK